MLHVWQQWHEFHTHHMCISPQEGGRAGQCCRFGSNGMSFTRTTCASVHKRVAGRGHVACLIAMARVCMASQHRASY